MLWKINRSCCEGLYVCTIVMMKNRPDYILDLSSVHQPTADKPSGGGAGGVAGGAQGRPWIAVQWKCCRTYSRIYRNKQGTAYEGRCPKCGKQVRASVGEGGTNNRFFEAK